MTSAAKLARYVIRVYQEAGDPVSNLKLQKLLYYIQGWHLAFRGVPAFDDPIEAWVHGPVVRSVYGSYKQYRWNPIVEEIAVDPIEPDLKAITDSVLEAYGGESGYQLEIRTHGEPPWLEARAGIPADQESRAQLKIGTMKTFFEQLNRGRPS